MKVFLLALGLMLAATAAWAQGPPSEVINQGRVLRAVTPSDTVDLVLGATRGIYTGATSCNLAVIAQDDTAAVLLTGVAAGAFLPVRAKRIMAANTTCTGIVGLW
jgi:hypothetical protein